MAFGPAPAPKSLLGYHRILAPTAGARVSPLCLGAMNFGESWKQLLGECSKETAFAMLDFFAENGGNFIDTANNYQQEESEIWIGEWMKSRGCRDEIFLATKYTTLFPADPSKFKVRSNFQGNHSKSLKLSVEASLRKLQTDYIDLLYLHWWDFTTSIPELMHALNQLVLSGKVLYLGISDTPAWIVSKANQYARDHGMRPFSVYQGRWSAASRDFERDILPMVQDEGMALAPWGALGGGKFKTKEDLEKGEGRKMGGPTDSDIKVTEALKKIADKKNTAITSVALAYVMHKAPYVFPIVGGRKVDHLKGNIEALSLQLSPEEMDEIDAAAPFDVGFPMNFLFEFGEGKYHSNVTYADVGLTKMAGHLDAVRRPQPIKPRGLDS